MPPMWASLLCLAATASAFHFPNILVKDVAVIGGGASGAYAAVRLRDDYGKSIALVEKEDQLVSAPQIHRASAQEHR